MDRAGIPSAKDESDRVGSARQPAAPPSPPSPPSESLANAADPEPPAWMKALSADLQPLGKALERAMQSGDDSAMRAALKKISATMPEFMASAKFESAIQDQLLSALTDEA
jgi:hypothetical protein